MFFVANECGENEEASTNPSSHPHTTTAAIITVFYEGYTTVSMWLNAGLRHLNVGLLVFTAKIGKWNNALTRQLAVNVIYIGWRV